MPAVSRQHATFSTDPSVVDARVRPAVPHRAIGTMARKTHYVARGNTTRRQRVARLVRAAWSFSKKRVNLIGTLKRFMCHDNLTRAAA